MRRRNGSGKGMADRVKRVFALSVCLLLVMTVPALAQKRVAVVNAESGKLHLRSAPSASSESLGLYFTGTQIMVTGDMQNGFFPVRVGAQTGYMHADYLAMGDAAQAVASVQPIGMATPKAGARFRSGPSTEYDTLDVIAQGEVFTVLGETKNHWYCAEYGGQVGYVSAEVSSLVDEVNGRPLAFYDVLTGKAPFEVRGGRRYMHELAECFGVMEADVVPTSFAVLELDDDGLWEVVIRVQVAGWDYGYLVLDLQTELVYGIPVPLRAMLDLKIDGTFTCSSGAMNTGVGSIRFSGPIYEIVPVDLTPQEQDTKPDEYWHSFTEDQFDMLFTRH